MFGEKLTQQLTQMKVMIMSLSSNGIYFAKNLSSLNIGVISLFSNEKI